MKPCGTTAAYQRHLKLKEPPCESCKAASREDSRRKYKPSVCPGCGSLMGRGPRGGSDLCRDCRGRPAWRNCVICGNEFRPRWEYSKACSPKCGQIVRWGHPAKHRKNGRICEVCGKIFVATYDLQRTCSRSCGVLIHGRTLNAAGKTCRIWVADCLTCGSAFTAHGNMKSSYCSRACRRAARFTRICVCGERLPLGMKRRVCDNCRHANDLAARRAARRRRKARQRGAVSEPYTLAQIAERDGWRCGLCRKLVAMDKPIPHPKAPTIDHVVPLSRGGDDTRANVQLAHFLCNSIKGAGGSQQLALFG